MAITATTTIDADVVEEIITASPEVIEAIKAEADAGATKPAKGKVTSKPSAAALKKAAEEAIAEAFEDLTTALSQSGASVAAAEAAAQSFVTGIAGLRTAKVSQEKVSKDLAAQAKKQGVDVPFSAAGYITVAEVVAAVLARTEDGDLGTVTRSHKVEDKVEKYEAAVIVRVDGFGGVKTGHDEVEVFSVVRAVTAPQGVPFLSAMGVGNTEFGKDAALRIIAEAPDANAAVRELDKQGKLLKSKIAEGKRIARLEKEAKEAKPVTAEDLIADFVDSAVNLAGELSALAGGEDGEPLPVEQKSLDALIRALGIVQSVIDNKVIEPITTAA